MKKSSYLPVFRFCGLASVPAVFLACGELPTDPQPLDADPLLSAAAAAADHGNKGKIVFARDGDIWAMNADGSGERNVTNDPDIDATPTWSRNGQSIVFSHDGNIHVMNADGSNSVMVTSGPKRDLYPHMSPDGRQIVFSRDVNNVEVPQIFVINVDGSGETNLTNNVTPACFQPMGPPPTWIPDPDCLFEAYPRWSPNGKQILFNSAPLPVDGDIWVMNADGSGRRNVSNSPNKTRNDFFASWSPSGKQIAFSGAEGWIIPGLAPDDIYVMNVDGSGLRKVTDNQGPDRNIGPDWSPNGNQLVFYQESGSSPLDVFTIDLDGTNQRQLTSGPGNASPNWASGPLH